MNEIFSFSTYVFYQTRRNLWAVNKTTKEIISNVNLSLFFAVLTTGKIGDRMFLTDTAFDDLDWMLFG